MPRMASAMLARKSTAMSVKIPPLARGAKTILSSTEPLTSAFLAKKALTSINNRGHARLADPTAPSAIP